MPIAKLTKIGCPNPPEAHAILVATRSQDSVGFCGLDAFAG